MFNFTGKIVRWGGKSVGDHASAQIDAWQKALRFLKDKLPPPTPTPASKL